MKWTASALQSTCAYQNVLRKLVPPTKNFIEGCARGTQFHEAVEAIATGGARPNVSAEVSSWIDRLFLTWDPPPGALYEDALGLSPGGKHVAVTEPEPHRYCAVDPNAELLTAGRADLIWFDGDVVVVSDWKTSRLAPTEPNKTLQLLALGFAAADRAGASAFRLELYHARTATWYRDEPIHLDSELAAERWRWVENAANLDDQPHVSRRCCWCFVRGHCDAYQADRLEKI